MAYIGSTPTSQNFISGTDYFNGTGSQTAFTLTRSVNSVNDVEVVVNNVIQQPNSYTVSGTTLTLSAAPSSGTSNVYVRYLATNQQSFTVGNNTVGYNQLTTDMQSKFAMKNRIINGAMVIDQRNAGASVTVAANVSTFPVDRFYVYASQASKLTAQQNAGSVTPPAGFTNYLGVTSSSAYSVGSSDYFQLRHVIEGFNIADLGWGTANAKTITLSFWVYSSLTGQFGAAIRNNPNYTYAYPFTFTIAAANTWQYVTTTIVGPNASQGVWNTNNTAGLEIVFDLGCGSTFLASSANTWQNNTVVGVTGDVKMVSTNGATFYITGVQLEVGSSQTGYEYRNYQQELAMCQRYYEASTDNLSSLNSCTMYNGRVVSGNTYWVISLFKVDKRAAPTMVLTNQASASFSTTTGVEGSTTKGYREARVASGTADAGYYFSSWTASAEL